MTLFSRHRRGSKAKKNPAENWSHVVQLLREEDVERAGSLFFRLAEQKVVQHLRIQYGWAESEAKSLLHDAFLVVQRKVKSEELSQLNLSYVKKICAYLGANATRKTGRAQQRFLQYAQEIQDQYYDELKSQYGLVFTKTDKEEYLGRYGHALEAFQKLGRRCQQLIRLRYVEEKSPAEISDAVEGISNGNSAKTLLSRCLKKWNQLRKSQ